MADLSQWVFAPAGVRELDRIAIEEQGTPGYELMQRAARFAFEQVVERYPDRHSWRVYCGGGNNAGDGYVMARLAAAAGKAVTVVAVTPPEQLTGDAAQAWQDFAAAGGSAIGFAGAPPSAVDALCIDALLGTGLTRELDGDYRRAVEQINATGGAAVAVDIPSGLCAATGRVLGVAVRAAMTITFVGLKAGLYLGAGPDHTGRLSYSDLGIAAAALTRLQQLGATQPELRPVLRRLVDIDISARLPERPRGGHKGQHGHVLVIGGNTGFAGAAQLAGTAALRAGAGLVSVATRAEHVAALVGARPELMVRGVAAAADLDDLLRRAGVVAVGPGLGQDAWAEELFDAALASELPLVVDADALNLLARQRRRCDNWVLTPHPGEAARLLQCSAAEVQADRVAAVTQLQQRYGGVALLKGHGTLVQGAQGPPWLVTAGNPGMGTAGMGDVLTGIVAALLAQFPTSERGELAAVAGGVHGAAGDRAAGAGERGLLASDLLAELRAGVNPA